mgnify:CR=1 FL=1
MKSFPSSKIEDLIKFVKDHKIINDSTVRLHATGGGAYKYQTLFEQEFGSITNFKLLKHDEMESMVNGMTFVL